MGVAFLLAGLLGFVMPSLLGFHLTTIHNVIHLATAAVALYLGFAGTYAAARTFCIAFGAVYLALGAVFMQNFERLARQRATLSLT
jgi:hypothetical protein